MNTKIQCVALATAFIGATVIPAPTVAQTKIVVTNPVDDFGDPVAGKKMLLIETVGTLSSSAGSSDKVRVKFWTRPENWTDLPSNDQEDAAWTKNKKWTVPGGINFGANYASTGAAVLGSRSGTYLTSKFKFSDGKVIGGQSLSYGANATVGSGTIFTISTKLIGKLFAEEANGTGKVKFHLAERKEKGFSEVASVTGTLDLSGFSKSLASLTGKNITTLKKEIVDCWKFAMQDDAARKRADDEAWETRQRLLQQIQDQLKQSGN